MTHDSARILQGYSAIADGVAVWINEETDRTGLQSWEGHLEMVRVPEVMTNIQGPFGIELTDGRAGEFLVREIDLLARPVSVSIVGVGPLK